MMDAIRNYSQLDNENQVNVYQIEALKDDLTEIEEEHVKVVKDMKEKTRALDLLKRDFNDLQDEYRMMQEVLSQRDKLIQDHGLVVVNIDGGGDEFEDDNQRTNGDRDENGGENCNGTETASATKSTRSSRSRSASVQPSSSASIASSKDLGTSNDVSSLFNGQCLISRQIINLLDSFEGNTLEAKMKCMAEEREDLILEVQRLRLEVEDERARNETLSVVSDHRPPTGLLHSLGTSNGIWTPSNIEGSTCGSSSGDNEYDMKKLLHDYKFKLKKAEQEIALLQRNNTRLEAQLKRANDSIKEAEELEDKLKVEKRKILRELRETQTKVEELELANDGLKKKVEKLKETRLDRIISSNRNPVVKEGPPKE